MERNFNSFQKWGLLQQKLSLFVFPVAAAGGFILGSTIGSGKLVEVFLYNPRDAFNKWELQL